MISREYRFGSTTSTCRPASEPSHEARGGAALTTSLGNGTVNVNTLPTPGSLSTSIVPSMASTRRATMASPSPVPPKRRERDSSACANGSKIRERCSSGMPTPVSCTSNRT
jgi:hypothetical protein